MNQFRFFKWGTYAMIITGAAHLFGHFQAPNLSTPAQKNLYDLMSTVQFELDPMFTRSAMDVSNAFSLFLSMMLFLLFVACFIVLRSDPNPELIKKLSISIAVGMLGMVLISLLYGFSIPIILFTIIMTLMFISYFRIKTS